MVVSDAQTTCDHCSRDLCCCVWGWGQGGERAWGHLSGAARSQRPWAGQRGHAGGGGRGPGHALPHSLYVRQARAELPSLPRLGGAPNPEPEISLAITPRRMPSALGTLRAAVRAGPGPVREGAGPRCGPVAACTRPGCAGGGRGGRAVPAPPAPALLQGRLETVAVLRSRHPQLRRAARRARLRHRGRAPGPGGGGRSGGGHSGGGSQCPAGGGPGSGGVRGGGRALHAVRLARERGRGRPGGGRGQRRPGVRPPRGAAAVPRGRQAVAVLRAVGGRLGGVPGPPGLRRGPPPRRPDLRARGPRSGSGSSGSDAFQNPGAAGRPTPGRPRRRSFCCWPSPLSAPTSPSPRPGASPARPPPGRSSPCRPATGRGPSA